MDIKKIQKSIGEQYGYVLRSDAYTDDEEKSKSLQPWMTWWY